MQIVFSLPSQQIWVHKWLLHRSHCLWAVLAVSDLDWTSSSPAHAIKNHKISQGQCTIVRQIWCWTRPEVKVTCPVSYMLFVCRMGTGERIYRNNFINRLSVCTRFCLSGSYTFGGIHTLLSNLPQMKCWSRHVCVHKCVMKKCYGRIWKKKTVHV